MSDIEFNPFAPASKKQAMMLNAIETTQITIIGGAAGCLPAEAQFLTDRGWVDFDKYEKGMVVAQYNPHQDVISFTDKVEYVKLEEKDLVRLEGKGLQMTLSEEHKVLYWNDGLPQHQTLSYSEVKDRHDKSKTKGWTGKIKTSFSVDVGTSVNLTEGELRLQVAVMADGRIVKGGKDNYTQMRFSKKRKYDRLISLCRKYNLRYDDRGYKDHDRYLSGKAYEVIVYPKLKDKRFDSKYWQCNQEQLDIIADEVVYWDGTFTPTGSKRYTSRYESDVDFIQYVFASQGMNTSKTADTRKDNTYWTTNGNNSGKGFRSFANKDGKIPLETILTTDGYKYCFVTQTGFLPVRENGKIYLTGNSGKSYILQLVPLLFADDPKAQCIMFRRTTPQLKGQGGIWDTAKGIYLSLPKGKRPRVREKDSEIIFPNFQDRDAGDGMVVKYSHMQHEDDKLNHQGLQYTFVGFDEGCQFTWTQIDYLMSRLRSESKYFSRMAISCNPDSEHKIKEMIQWYLDEDGYPIPEKDGVVRYFIRVDGDFVWGETAKELTDIYGEDFEPLSMTFVSATIYDNPPMLKNNPSYLSFLKGLDPINRAQLLDGNWNVKPEGNNYFKRENLVVVDKLPSRAVRCRAWDLASQEVTVQNKDCDFTASVGMVKCPDGYYYIFGDFHPDNYDNLIEEQGRFRKRVGERDKIIAKQGHYDGGTECTVVIPVDPAASGKVAYEELARRLIEQGLSVRPDPAVITHNKLRKFTPFSDAVEAGLVRIVKSSFDPKTYDSYLSELERFDGERSGKSVIRKDDRADATATAFNFLVKRKHVPIVVRNQSKSDTLVSGVLSSYMSKLQ